MTSSRSAYLIMIKWCGEDDSHAYDNQKKGGVCNFPQDYKNYFIYVASEKQQTVRMIIKAG